ncbi:Glutaredoxin, partial [Scheffersomyces stipitis CBS 6054]
TDKVVVYSKTYCPYCTSTKNLFQGLGQEFKLVELDINSNGSEIQRGLQELTGQRTVPNVFINGKHIGGNSDLQALNSSGKLKGLLA